MTVFIVLLIFLLAYWGLESWRLRRALRAIPVRIHVNGSRGKSSVTRLIAAALREAGIRTAAKTTGTRARYIAPDGSEQPVVRVGTPNICEQVGVLDRARRQGAQAIVLECMAIRPDLQRVCEERIVHATIGVITNVRADHLDVMGPTLADAALAMAGTLPARGLAVAGETAGLTELEAAAERRGSHLVMARAAGLPEGAMERFGYLEHEDNVAVALEVCRGLGVPDAVSLSGMAGVAPDPGACTRWRLEHGGVAVEFHNIFAANDLESTIGIWERLGLDQRRPGSVTIALLNLRGDRIDRSLQFAEAVEGRLQADYYVLAGDVPGMVQRRFARRVPAERLVALGRSQPGEIFDRLARLAAGAGRARVGGIGNIGGLGHAILDFVTCARGGRLTC